MENVNRLGAKAEASREWLRAILVRGAHNSGPSIVPGLHPRRRLAVATGVPDAFWPCTPSFLSSLSFPPTLVRRCRLTLSSFGILEISLLILGGSIKIRTGFLSPSPTPPSSYRHYLREASLRFSLRARLAYRTVSVLLDPRFRGNDSVL